MKKVISILLSITTIVALCFSFGCNTSNGDDKDKGEQIKICSHDSAVAVCEYVAKGEEVYQQYNCESCSIGYKKVEKGYVANDIQDIKSIIDQDFLRVNQNVVLYLRDDVVYKDAQNSSFIDVPTSNGLTIYGGGKGATLFQLRFGHSGSAEIFNATIKNVTFNSPTNGFLAIRSMVDGLTIENCMFSGKNNLRCDTLGSYSKDLKNVVIDGCTFTNIQKKSADDCHALTIEKCENLTIKNCVFENVIEGNAIFLGTNEITGNLVIENNIMLKIGARPLVINNCLQLNSSLIKNNIFGYNELLDNGMDLGLYVNVLNGNVTMGANSFEYLPIEWDSFYVNNVTLNPEEQTQYTIRI